MANLLFVTDLDFQARGRDYGSEDRELIAQLKEYFDMRVIKPFDKQLISNAIRADLVVVRNSGSVSGYREQYDEFRAAAQDGEFRVFNSHDGKADQTANKAYLVELFDAGLQVIPSALTLRAWNALPLTDSEYLAKPVGGADSDGLVVGEKDPPEELFDGSMLVQPRLTIAYEISFYFLNGIYQYGLRSTTKRWEMEPWEPSEEQLAVAQTFVGWNTMSVGIQRVDFLVTPAGEMLLTEVEDLNPYLNLHSLDDATRRGFTYAFVEALQELVNN